MAKVFLTCFAPFKPLYLDELAIGFFSSLSIDLQQLQKCLENKPPCLRWCSEAVCVIKKIHSHFLCYLESSEVPPSWAGVKMLDEYMTASLDLLDLCNLLRLALSSLDRYRMMVDVAINRLEDHGFSIEASKIELERLERGRSDWFSEVEKWRGTNSNKEEMSKMKMKTMTKTNNNKHVLQVIRSAMSILSLLIVCSILHPSSIEINEGICTGLPGLDLFLDSIQKLVRCFAERVRAEKDKGRLVLYENERIDDAFASLKVSVVNGDEKGVIVEKVEKLRKRCVALKEGLDLFEGVMNELFEDVVKGRKRMIEFITQNNHTP